MNGNCEMEFLNSKLFTECSSSRLDSFDAESILKFRIWRPLAMAMAMAMMNVKKEMMENHISVPR
jgi:hypothetical protein